MASKGKPWMCCCGGDGPDPPGPGPIPPTDSAVQLKILDRYARFLYPKVLEKWILESTGRKWKDYKCSLKAACYSEEKNISEIHNACSDNVLQDQWISLVNFWRSPEGKKRAENSKKSLANAKQKENPRPISTTGTKSHARVAEAYRQKHGKSPTRTELYLECHKHKDEAIVTDKIKQVDCKGGFFRADEDPVTKVLGKDKYGRVRGLGLGVKPSKVSFNPSRALPRYCKDLNMSSTDDETVSLHHIRLLNDRMKRVERDLAVQSDIIDKQADTIRMLKRKLREWRSDSDSELDDSDGVDGYFSEKEESWIPDNSSNKGRSTEDSDKSEWKDGDNNLESPIDQDPGSPDIWSTYQGF